MSYIHSKDSRIAAFIKAYIHDTSSAEAVSKSLLLWFDQNVGYSRLNAPFFPLQRSDLDVLSMRCGTCGDYSNLIVSVLVRLGYEAAYAYVHKDCYGDEQDHVCAAVRDGQEWALIDAAMPYRKWYGFRCPHREFDLLSVTAFEEKMKQEEACWTDAAKQYGNDLYAGLLYAPWIHERIIRETGTVVESAFYLLATDAQKRWTLHVYLLRYTRETGSIPVTCMIAGETRTYRFSREKPDTIWDDRQWGEAYPEDGIPDAFQTETLRAFQACIDADLPKITEILLYAQHAARSGNPA